MSDAHRERELKFAVPDGFTVPDLSAVLPRGGSVENETLDLESTYYDTADRDLLAAGLTLRRRTGDADQGWHLKVPAGKARTEIRVPLGGRGVPAEMRQLTAGQRGRSALRPVATLRTERHVHRLLDKAGQALAEVVDDDVVSHTEREFAITRRWREIEVELVGGGEKLLARTASFLHEHGAEDAAIGSKLLHALDVPGRPAPDTETLGGVVARYLDEQFEALVRGDIELRRAVDGSAVDGNAVDGNAVDGNAVDGNAADDGRDDVVHPTRVATRRYRSVLRVFAPVIDADRAAHLDGELKWYAARLGEVRDTQVLREHLDAALDALPADLDTAAARTRMDTTLDAQEAAARQALAEVMTGRRYLALMRELRRWRDQPPVLVDGPAKDVRKYLRRAERTLDKRLAVARGADRGDESHHRARKAAKRARYIAELCRPVLGSKAAKSLRRAKKLQKRFGDRQDNVLAAQFLLRAAAGGASEEFVFGVLYQRERDRGDAIE